MDIVSLAEGVKEFISSNSLQPYLAATAGALVAGYASFRYELNRSKTIPLAYSELQQIIGDSQAKDQKPNELTFLFASVNDLCMQIFESYNNSSKKNTLSTFNDEIQKRYTTTNHGSTISSLLSESKDYADKSLSQLKTHLDAYTHLIDIVSTFDAAWDESHEDHYRTEYYTSVESYTDSNGRSQTRLVTKSRQVYDYTQHTYDYNKEKGVDASQKLISMYQNIVSIPRVGKFIPASKMSFEGKQSAMESRRIDTIEDEQLEKISKTWCDGIKHDEEMEEVVSQYSSLEKFMEDWYSAKETAKPHYSYRTSSSSDDGPVEYQVARKAWDTAKSIATKINSLKTSIDLIYTKLPLIKGNIEKYLSVSEFDSINPSIYERDTVRSIDDISNNNVNNTNNGDVGRNNGDFSSDVSDVSNTVDSINNVSLDPKQLKKDILNDSKELYSELFKDGIDVDRFKEWRVGLFSALGAGIGVGAYFLLEAITNPSNTL